MRTAREINAEIEQLLRADESRDAALHTKLKAQAARVQKVADMTAEGVHNDEQLSEIIQRSNAGDI